MWELKYYANKRAAMFGGRLLAETLITIASEELGKPLLIPIPMSAKRRKKRRYNQCELLCEATLPHLRNAMDYAAKVLVRERDTVQQQGLEKHRRLKNVRKSMRVYYPEQVRGRVCIVVDDVTTTGATFTEAKRVLFIAGASEVHCVALAG